MLSVIFGASFSKDRQFFNAIVPLNFYIFLILTFCFSIPVTSFSVCNSKFWANLHYKFCNFFSKVKKKKMFWKLFCRFYSVANPRIGSIYLILKSGNEYSCPIWIETILLIPNIWADKLNSVHCADKLNSPPMCRLIASSYQLSICQWFIGVLLFSSNHLTRLL